MIQTGMNDILCKCYVVINSCLVDRGRGEQLDTLDDKEITI